MWFLQARCGLLFTIINHNQEGHVLSQNSCYLVRGLQLRNEKRSLQALSLKFVKGLRLVPHEAALQQLQLFSLTSWRIRGDLIFMFKITHGLWDSPWSPPSPIELAQGYAGMPICSTNKDAASAVANTLSAFGPSRFRINYGLI